MCTGKDEVWGDGNVSSLSRGFLVVEGADNIAAAPGSASYSSSAAAGLWNRGRTEGSTGLAAGTEVGGEDKAGQGQGQRGRGQVDCGEVVPVQAVVARRRARRGENVSRKGANAPTT